MTDTAPAIALLFDDGDLGSQLREALQERGARIVHEGGVSSLSRELLQQVGIDVLVVNLDDGADDALDHLYDVIDGDRPRVVFNDAQASRSLAGWDRARWARHLAVKALSAGDIDPPRPGDARAIEAAPAVAQPVAAVAEPAPAVVPPPLPAAPEEILPVTDQAALEEDLDLPVTGDSDGQHEQAASAESESLAAELEALLASGELPAEDEEESGPGLRSFDEDALPPLHDGDFGQPATVPVAEDLIEAPQAAVVDVVADRSSAFGELELSPQAEASVSRPAPAPVTAPSAPDSWSLLDDDAPMQTARTDASEFGIEKLSAADFLAPDVDSVVPEFEPTMSLELVSMEEAIAPQAYEHQDHEMVLDELGSALSRVVLLGAAVDGIDAVCTFLQGLPAGSRLTFLHAQHLGGQPAQPLVEKLAVHSTLPVRLAANGGRVGGGEVLVVPPGQQLHLRRDGRIELRETGEAGADPSIDATLTMAANAFGRDALAIVFAGRGNDAVAGAQAIHDRGGQVWVESSGEHFADMVGGIFAERLVSFSGTPNELAAHLIEVFP